MDDLYESGKKLPSAAKILAVSSYTQFLDKFGVIGQIEPRQWDQE